MNYRIPFVYLGILVYLTISAFSAVAQPDSAQIQQVAKDSLHSSSVVSPSQGVVKSESIALLPEILSPGEKIMWGEHGFMRWTGLYPLTEESRTKELKLRRTMLTVHELGGFATLAAMIATATYGQLTLNGDKSLGETHKTLASITIFSYFSTAALSLLSPPPLVRRKEWSTISIHKGLATIHFTGMVLTPLLAQGVAMQERDAGKSDFQINEDKAQIHQISGYITTLAFASAMAVITF